MLLKNIVNEDWKLQEEYKIMVLKCCHQYNTLKNKQIMGEFRLSLFCILYCFIYNYYFLHKKDKIIFTL